MGDYGKGDSNVFILFLILILLLSGTFGSYDK